MCSCDVWKGMRKVTHVAFHIKFAQRYGKFSSFPFCLCLVLDIFDFEIVGFVWTYLVLYLTLMKRIVSGCNELYNENGSTTICPSKNSSKQQFFQDNSS